jgi:type IV pilus assembly protein PilP
MNKTLSLIGILCASLVLTACGTSDTNQDLHDYIRATKARPKGEIEPLPSFRPYRPFAYSAMTLRSPFDPPVREEDRAGVRGGPTVQPDLNREREYLENFNIGNLRMVGTLTRNNRLWALIDDGQGGVHSVTEGNYMGRNHGRIISTTRTQIEVLEIIADGSSGWVERPRIIKLQEKE